MRFASEGNIHAPLTCLKTHSLPVLATISLLSVLWAATLTGCGIGALDTSSPQVAQIIPAFKGTVFGGQSPIVNATLRVYATGSDGACTSSDSAATCIASDAGYGTATLLQEASLAQDCGSNGTSACNAGQETDVNGGFSFAGGYFCPAGEFAYIVGSGGSPANMSNPGNSDILLVAALGRCEDLYNSVTGGYSGYKGSSVYVNEITTIAAGYALGHFATVSGGTVLIGAPSTNNAPKSGGYSVGTTAAAAGLYHAFLNAANLANPFSATTLAGAPTTTTAGNGTVPAALINVIGNVLANCIDSGSGSPECAGLPGSADTFTAVQTLARNPTFSGSGTAVSNFFNLPNGSGPFAPILSAAPNDFSIGIVYTAGTYPISEALDVNDNLYVGVQNASASTAQTIYSFSSNGTQNTGSPLTGSLKYAYGMSVDANSHGYYAGGNGSKNNAVGTFTFSPPTGAISSANKSTINGSNYAYATAVDRNNNVWVAGAAANTTTNLLFEAPAGSGTLTFTSYAVQGLAATVNPNQIGLAIDNSENVWVSFSNSTSSGTVSILPSGATSSTTPIAPTGTTFAGNPAIGITFNSGVAYISSYTTPDIQPFTSTPSSGQITGVSGGSATTVGSVISGSIYNTTDGAGTIWLADTVSQSVINYNPTNTTAWRYKPCLVASTTCSNSLASKPWTVAVDSTGSLWATVPAGGTVVQIIGSANPSWPLLALGKYGVSP